jgi:hypothetical protein
MSKMRFHVNTYAGTVCSIDAVALTPCKKSLKQIHIDISVKITSEAHKAISIITGQSGLSAQLRISGVDGKLGFKRRYSIGAYLLRALIPGIQYWKSGGQSIMFWLSQKNETHLNLTQPACICV